MTTGESSDWQSFGRKLPLLTTALLTITVVVLAGMAYREMKRSLLGAAGQRVGGVAQQIAAILGASNMQLQREGSPLSRDSSLSAALLHPDRASLAAATRRLSDERVDGQAVMAGELWDMHGTRVLAVGPLAGRPASFSDVRAAYASPAGPFIALHDTILIDARLPIVRGSDTLGFVRALSRVSKEDTRQQLRALIGDEGVLYVGNTSGDVWTDLATRVAGPPPPYTAGAMVQSRLADGSQWMGALSAVPGSSWQVWVALPESFVLGRARSFLVRLSLVALLLIVLGTVAARRLSRHVIAPLTDVTTAAERIASGDYSVRVPIVRHDEVGRLAAAFNEMAAAIQIAALDLENQQIELETQQTELEEINEHLHENIDEATRAREAAERARARAAAIVAGAIDAIATTDETSTIVEFNPAAERMFGYTAAQAIGRRIDQLVPAVASSADAGGLAAFVDHREHTSRGVRTELMARRADDSELSVELAVAQIPVSGPPMFTVFLRDLSDRKQLEDQLRQMQKMEAVGRLAGGVAHDFNNILTVVISYTDLVLADSALSDIVRSDLDQVRAAADRATALTRQLLAFSRKQVLHPVVMDINTVVGEVSAMLARIVPENIRIDTRLGAGVALIHVDRGQIEQVLMNLAVNARDAMPNGGVLTIETANAVLDDAYVAIHSGGAPGPHVVLSVRDTGVGMDADTRERIFEPFFTTKALGQGTGLGLATVYGIVRQSGGSIYVYSEPGHGTTFKIYFPAHAGDAYADDDMAVGTLPSLAPVTVLLVEDDSAVREATRVVLAKLGHTVVSAPDAAEALQIIRAGEPLDVVLTDAVMPGLSGLDLAEILNTERPELPVIVMSGYTEEAVSGGRAVARGVAFVEKPFTGQQITRALISVSAATSYP